MQTHDLKQGTPEWAAHRARHFNASDAPAMLGCSPYMTRTQLLHAMHTGIRQEADPNLQRRFDKGHEIEAAKRPLAESIIGEDLYPVVGSEGELSASFDGLTMQEDTNWECKSLNADLRAALPYTGDPSHNQASQLPKAYRVQMEQQCLVSGATRALFTASDGQNDDRHCWYTPDPALSAEIVAGWKQFAEDLAVYKPAEIAEMPQPEVTLALPALFIQAKGEITTSNMEAYGIALAAKLKSIRAIQLVTDQDFSNAKDSAEMLRDSIQKAKLAKEAMLAQTVTVGEAASMIDAWCEDMRLTALKLEKDVEREDKAKKATMIAAVKDKYEQHVRAIEGEISPVKLTLAAPVFAEAIKNKRNFASMQDALDTMLANAKIAADSEARQIRANLECIKNDGAGFDFLFADSLTLVRKSLDDLRLLVRTRISDHKAAEEKKETARREEIRLEELGKLQKAEAEENRMRMSQISGIQQQVIIASMGRAGVRKGGTVECIRETLSETEAWAIEESNFGGLTAMAQAAKDKAVQDIRALLVAAEAKPATVPTAATVRHTTLSPDGDLAHYEVQAPAANSPTVVAIRPTSPPTLKLGDINARIAPMSIDAAGLAQLGFPFISTDRSAKLYHEADFARMLDSMVAHLRTAQAKQLQAA